MAGATALDAWLEGRPWCARGGVRTLRVGDARCAERLADALRRAVRVIDDGATDVQVAAVQAREVLRDPIAALAEAAGCAASEGRRHDRVLRLGRALDHPPWVFVVTPEDDAPPGALHRSLTTLAEEFQQLPRAVPLTCVLMTTAHEAQADDFVHGDVFAAMPAERDDLDWSWYLRLRLSWEVGGRLDMADAWWPEALVPEDDVALERWLDDHATARWNALDEALRDAFVVRVVTPNHRERGLDARLREAALLWQPSGLLGVRATPWAARGALLTRNVVGADALRHALTCAPLARELLARCVDLERHLRMAKPPSGAPAADTRSRAARYATDGTRERAHYTAAAMVVPGDPWSYATLGDYLAATQMREGRREKLHALRELRNHVAHGHFVGWHAVRELRRLEAALT